MIYITIKCDTPGCSHSRSMSPLDIDIFDRQNVHEYWRRVGWITPEYDHLCHTCQENMKLTKEREK